MREIRNRLRRSIQVATAAVAAATAVVATIVPRSPPTPATCSSLSLTKNTHHEAFVCGPAISSSTTSTPAHAIHRPLWCKNQRLFRSVWHGRRISGGVGRSVTLGDIRGSSCSSSSSSSPLFSVNRDHKSSSCWKPRSTAVSMHAAGDGSEPSDNLIGGEHLAGTRTGLTGGEQQKQQGGRKREGGRRRPFGHITDETLDLIRSSTSITEVIGQHVEMKPAGRGMVGCCPFHDDRTPSFSVDDSRGSYHCFGCGARGDVIQFVMQMEGLGFREAVRELAEEAGVSLDDADADPSESGGGGGGGGDEKERKEARERLSLVLQMAAQFYTRCLVEMPAAGIARAHLLERGISPMTVMDFQLGYSPADLTSPLIEYLDQQGFEMETLVDAGLAPDTSKWRYPTSPGNPRSRVDRFRGRLVVPIRDHRGTVLGFGARDLSDSQANGNVGSGFVIPDAVPSKHKAKAKGKGKKAKAAAAAAAAAFAGAPATVGAVSEEGVGSEKAGGKERDGLGLEGQQKVVVRPPAKYLNSPETSLFKKGKNVFGLDLAKETIRSEDMAVVVEGYFDVIKMHDAGIRCAVGVLGTSITVDQLMLCARYSRSKRVVLCMDGDDAGQRAVERLCESPASSGLDSLSEAGVSISVASIPRDSGCKDPADYLQAHGAQEFRTRVVDRALPWSDWYGDRILAEHDFSSDANAFRRCTDRLTGFISDLSIPTDQTFHVHRFAKALARGNEVMQHQLEFDLMAMSKEKRARKNALRSRVVSPPPPPPEVGSSGMASPSSPLPTHTPPPQPEASAPAAELRRLASGQATDSWDLVTGGVRREPRGSSRGSRGTNVVEDGDVLRNHEWVMERVKIRKKEESRRKREKSATAISSVVWSPSEEQRFEDPVTGEPRSSREQALRQRILDQAQRYLLALAVHDPSRRGRCGQEVSRHGLSLGNERRQWLFEAVTRSHSTAAVEPINEEKGTGDGREKRDGASEASRGPSDEALEAGGKVLLAEIRAAAPRGYFEVPRGLAAGGQGEETLDWVFASKEAERVAAGKNTDLVLLEVVMVILKEQAAATMQSLSVELARTSDAIARTMAEAAAADLLTTKASRYDQPEQDIENYDDARDDGESRERGEVVIEGRSRSKAGAQSEVERLKARQAELFGLIREQREEVAGLEAQRRSFTSRLPRVRAENEADSLRKERSGARVETNTEPNPSQSQLPQIAAHESGAGISGRGRGKDDVRHVSPEESLALLPMVFLDEDQDPDNGIDFYDAEARIAAARAANAAAVAAASGEDGGGEERSPQPVDSRQRQDRDADAYIYTNSNINSSFNSLPSSSVGEMQTRESLGAPRRRQLPPTHNLPHARYAANARRDEVPSNAPDSRAAKKTTTASSVLDRMQMSQEPPERASGRDADVSKARRHRAAGDDASSRRDRLQKRTVAKQNASDWGSNYVAAPPPAAVSSAACPRAQSSENEKRMAREAEEHAEILEEDDAFESGWTV